VVNVIDNRRQQIESLRISAPDIEVLSASIDRPLLMEERKRAHGEA